MRANVREWKWILAREQTVFRRLGALSKHGGGITFETFPTRKMMTTETERELSFGLF